MVNNDRQSSMLTNCEEYIESSDENKGCKEDKRDWWQSNSDADADSLHVVFYPPPAL